MTPTLDDQSQQMKEIFGDHLTEKELSFLRETQKFFELTLVQKRGFQVAIKIVANKLKSFLREVPPSRLRLAFDACVFRDTLNHDRPEIERATDPMTETEVLLAQDIIDAIEFVIRNGIGFGLIASCLSHDINELLKAASSGKEAIFIPKVSGWAEYGRAQVAPTDLGDA